MSLLPPLVGIVFRDESRLLCGFRWRREWRRMSRRGITGMKHAGWILVGLCAAPVCLVRAQGDVRGSLSVLDLEELDPSLVDWTYSPATTVDLSDESRELSVEEFGGSASERDEEVSLVDTVSISHSSSTSGSTRASR